MIEQKIATELGCRREYKCDGCHYENNCHFQSDAKAILALIEQEQKAMRGLLQEARCPNCDGSGIIAHQYALGQYEQEQCQWCYTRDAVLGGSHE